jgi:cell division protein FtsI (penicillin-binding protein 3)
MTKRIRPAMPHFAPKMTVRRELRLTGNTAAALEVGRTRLLVAGMVFAMAFTVVGARLVDLALWNTADTRREARSAAPAQYATGRADIVDRNGIVLATSVPTASLYADPRLIRDPGRAAAALTQVLPDLSPGEVQAKLASGRSFVWIKRNLTPREHFEVNRLGIPGLNFRREFQRIYPMGSLSAHSVGFTDVDSGGLSGAERAFDKVLNDSTAPLRLSLDIRVQHILREEIAAAMDRFHAIGAAGIVLDARTGETLAMASLPDFDPNHAGAALDDERFNRATLGVYEMGSVFKIFTTAQALDSGAMTLNDGFDTSKPIRAARFTITDYKPKNRWLSVPEIFMYSSNIGTALMAMQIGTKGQQAFMKALGLTQPARIELGEVGAPLLPERWSDISTLTISYGHGMSVSPIQVATAVSSIVNGGVLVPSTILTKPAGTQVEGRRVISESTSRSMRDLMRLVVRQGTGRKADVNGLLVGGKTGTSDKLVNGRYVRDKRIASFVAAFPMTDPRYVVLVMVDEPKGIKETFNYATGGWVAAPAVGKVIERIAPILGVAPVTNGFETDSSERLLVKAKARAKQAEAQRIAAN